jgi:hypothetical protein
VFWRNTFFLGDLGQIFEKTSTLMKTDIFIKITSFCFSKRYKRANNIEFECNIYIIYKTYDLYICHKNDFGISGLRDYGNSGLHIKMQFRDYGNRDYGNSGLLDSGNSGLHIKTEFRDYGNSVLWDFGNSGIIL